MGPELRGTIRVISQLKSEMCAAVLEQFSNLAIVANMPDSRGKDRALTLLLSASGAKNKPSFYPLKEHRIIGCSGAGIASKRRRLAAVEKISFGFFILYLEIGVSFKRNRFHFINTVCST